MEFDVLRTRVSHHLATGRAAEAVDLLKENLQQHQENPAFWVHYASGLLHLDRHAEAADAARAALNLDVEQPEAGLFLAFALMRLGQRDEALQTVYWLIETWPEFADAHYLLGLILAGSVRSAEDRMLSRQATEHALRLQPENPEYYLGAAMAARVSGDHRAALAHLQAGLGIDPHHQGMLRYAAEVENGQQLVGDRGQLLRGLLASDPLNQGLHEDFAETFIEKQRVYRNRFWIFIPLLACLAMFDSLAEAAVLVIMPALIVLVSGTFALWNRKTFKKASEPLPAGYAGDIRARHPWVFRGLRLYRASWVAGLVGALLACFDAASLLGTVVLLLGVAGSQLAAAWVDREAAGVPQDPADREARRLFLLRRSGWLASGFWMRVLMVCINLVLFGYCADGGSRLATVPLAALGLGLLSVAVPLIVAHIRLGAAGNAFAYGQVVGASSRHRRAALVRGNAAGIYFIGLHLVPGLLATGFAAALLVMGPSALAPTDPLPMDPKRSELDFNLLDESLDELRTQRPEIVELPSLPAVELP